MKSLYTRALPQIYRWGKRANRSKEFLPKGFRKPRQRKMAERIREKYARRNLGKALVIVMAALVNFAAFSGMGPTYELGLGAFLLITLAAGARDTIHFILLFFLMSVMRDVLSGLTGEMPSIKALAPLVVSTLLVLPFRRKAALKWLRAGRADRITLALAAATCAVSIAALLIWAFRAQNLGEGPRMVRFFAAHFPAWTVFAFGPPLFALVNAFSEEAVYRGLSQETIGTAFGAWPALFLQSTLYAAAHFITGFPNGYAGYVMTFFYGCVLGYMRLRTGGLKAPYLTHIIADLVIGYFLAFKVL